MTRFPNISWSVAPSVVAILFLAGCPSSVQEDDLLVSGKKLYSQFDEELIIRHFFRDRKGGVFLDIGASDYQKLSNTFYLEKHLGWSGIAVDALAEDAPGYEEHRPRTRFFNYIVTDHSGTMETLYALGAISSTEENHVDYLKNWVSQGREEGNRPPRSKANAKLLPARFEPVEVQVPTITLNELLEQNDISTIDFLTMDIELGEPAALAGFDIQRFRPELVCIEAFEIIREEIATYFDQNGYERIDAYLEYDDRNWYYRPRDD